MADADLVPLLDLPPERAAAKLRAVGEFDAAAALESAVAGPAEAGTFGFSLGSIFGVDTPPWALPQNEVFGFVPPGAPGDLVDVIDIARVTPQRELSGTRVNVTLQRDARTRYPAAASTRSASISQPKTRLQPAPRTHATVSARRRMMAGSRRFSISRCFAVCISVPRGLRYAGI